MKKAKMTKFATCRGVEIYRHDLGRGRFHYTATFDGTALLSPDYKIIRRAIKRRKVGVA